MGSLFFIDFPQDVKKIKTKIIERSGYEEVFTVDGDMTGTSSDYNQIKDSVQTRMNYQ